MNRSTLRAYLRVVATVFLLHLKMQAVDLFVVFTVLIQPLLIALLAIYIQRDKAPDIAIYLIVGSGMTGLWSGLLFTSSFAIRGERWYGTLEMLVGTPTPLGVVMIGKVLASVLLSLSSMVVGYLMAAALFRFTLYIMDLPGFLISLALTLLAFVTFGLVIAPFFALSPAVEGWVNALEFPVYVLGGFLFPILMLPGWSTPLSYMLSPYWAAQALHATSSGSGSVYPNFPVALDWAMLLLFSAIYIFLSGRLFGMVLRRAKIDATLGLQ
ncbi:MAG: ABC transporter permease [Chloroflexi bacterium]|nr:ABC transporter permease [Chloroflexota bacterium]